MLCPAVEPKPPIISLLTLVAEQNQIENPAAILQGRIESLAWEHMRIERGSSGETTELSIHSRLTRYDVDGRVIEETDRQIGETRSTRTYSEGRLVSVKGRTFNKDGKQVGEEFWETYRYDPAGNLLDLRRGRGQTTENHFLSKYDSTGRLLERQIRQGDKNAIVFTEQFLYTGDPPTVQRRIVTPEGAPKNSTRYRLDEGGRIIELWSEDGYHVRWKYDGQQRVIEQSTDSYAVPNGCDDCPLPGTVRVRYADSAREEEFIDPMGKAALKRIVRLERDGSIASINYERPPGAREQDEPDLNRVVAAIVPLNGESYIETTWDSRNNWIEKRQIFKSPGGSPVIQFAYRRKITYR